MATAILFPQDVLTPQSRSKLQSPGPTYPFKPPPVSKRNRANFAQASDIGWLPAPAGAEISSPVYGDVNRTKAQKAFHWNSSSSNPLASDLYPHQFLQGRRQEGSVTESLAYFPSPGSLGLVNDVKRWQIESSAHVNVQSERTGGRNRLVGTDGDAKPTIANTVGRNDMFLTDYLTGAQDRFSSEGFVQLRRTMTEYPAAQRAKGHYTNVCKERWAGPAYSLSPHPSSLPLPKFCLPHMKSSSVDSPPFMKPHSASLYTKSANTSIASDENGGIWDAAFATKDLRRLLNLDS